jgi:PAS domain S-box-containing protein
MTEAGDENKRLQKLRQQAEAALSGDPVDLEGLPPGDIQLLLHELQVHQIELSMQNEELRRAQQELEVSRDQYLDLYNFAPAGYCTLDASGKIVEANQVLADMLGVRRAKLLNSSLSKFVAPQDQDRYHLHRRRTFDQAARQEDEIRMLSISGDTLITRLKSIPDHLDPSHLRTMITDITDLRATQDALHASQERLHLIEALRAAEDRLHVATTAANLGVWDWDLRTGAFTANPLFKSLLGLPLEAPLTLEDVLAAIHPRDRDKKQRCIQEMRGASELAECEYRAAASQGRPRWILDIGRSYLDEHGKTVRIVGVALDITHRKEREARLKENASELSRLNQELQDFVFIASHDLQEPLRKIRSFGEMLKSETGANTSLSEEELLFIERMQLAAGRMQSLIDNLLAYSRVTTQAAPYAPIDLTAAVQEALYTLEHRIEQSGAEVEVAELGTIEADPFQMRQLFENLIGNSLKFVEPGVPPRVKIYSTLKEGDSAPEQLEISVQDNGIGFDMDLLDQAFKPFTRLVGRSQYDGSGIGLAICRKIVERHGGTITARSQPGQGSTFIVTLPVRQQ